MGLSDKLANFVDGYYKIVDPSKLNARLSQRELSSRLSYRNAKMSRIVRGANYVKGSGDSHLKEGDLDSLREKSRELDRDNLFVKAIFDRLSEAVLGNGIDIQIQSPNKNWNKKAEKMFEDWWRKTPETRGMFSGPALERLVYRAKKVDGDILIIKTNRGLQAIEGDRIRTPAKMKDPTVVNGVKMDSYGKPIEFYIFEHQDRNIAKTSDYKTVKAEDCIFIAERHRLSMTRGIPVLTQTMELLEDIDAFQEASIIQQKISASHVMFIERNGGLDALDNITTTEDSYGNQRQEQIANPGTILYGEKGETAKMLGASQTGQQFSPFITQLLRFAGLPFGLPLEILSLDFSKTTYSSARASLLTAHKCFLQQHRQFVHEFMEPVVRWKINEFIKKGMIAEPSREYSVTSTPPKVISLDPLKETRSNVEAINAGLTSNREVCNVGGTSWFDTLNYREEEILQAIRIADNVVKRTGAEISFRDILGLSNSYKTEIFNDADADTEPSN